MSEPELPNSNLPNEELRRRLTVEFKIDCGPVTPSTRRVLLKKLAKLESERSFVSGVASDNRHDQNPIADNSINQVDESFVTNGKHNDSVEPLENGSSSLEINRTPKKNSPRRYSPRRKMADEIEAIKSFNEIKNKQLKKQSSPSQESFLKPKSPQKSIVKTVHVNDLSPKLNQYSSESSESEQDDNSVENTPPPPSPVAVSFLGSRIVQPRIYNGETFKAPLTRPPIRRTIVDNKSSTLQNYSDSESDGEEIKNDKLCKMLLSHRPGLGRNASSHKASYFAKVSSLFSSLKKKLTPSPTDSSTNFSSSSNYISIALLIFVVIFFIVIFSVYFYAKLTFNTKQTLDLNDYTFIGDKSKLVAPICEAGKDGALNLCLPFDTDRKPTLNIVKEIRSYIDNFVYKHNCELNDPVREISSFSFKNEDIKKALQDKVDLFSQERDPSLVNKSVYELFLRDFDNAIKLIKLNPSWNLKTSDFDQFEESVAPTADYSVQLPLRCNVWIIWRTNLLTIVATSVLVIVPLLGILYYRKTKRAASEEQSLVYELIEKSTELLQSPDEPQSMPVLHIRDTLLSPSERKSGKYRRIWNKVVNHIENAESRVKVEYKKIDGEDFKAWKWIASNAGGNLLSDNELDLDGSLAPTSQTQRISGIEWQGQAFSNLVAANKNAQPLAVQGFNSRDNLSAAPTSGEMYRNKNFTALTRFLKIRNIFEKEAHFLDPNWAKKIKNTILEKTASASSNGSHDIVHIELEDSPNEGLVYLKCNTIPGATSAFHALHGWWCEKKLVSVKFLKEDRYNMRFPQAKSANTPLKIESLE